MTTPLASRMVFFAVVDRLDPAPSKFRHTIFPAEVSLSNPFEIVPIFKIFRKFFGFKF